MTRKAALFTLAAAMIVHILLALGFAVATPFRSPGIILSNGRAPVGDVGAPDERQHANYAARFNTGQGLPVFDPKDPALYESYQSHQPPLYYFLEAKLTGWSGRSSSAGAILARWPNLLIGALAVAGVFAFGYLGAGRWEAGAALALVAAPWPMLCALSGAVSNDPLLVALGSWGLAALLGARRDGWTWRWALLFGVFAGLASLTKTTGVLLLPVGLLATFLVASSWREKLVGLGLGFLIPLPWWLRNLSLYGDPFALRAFDQAFTGSAQKSTLLNVIAATTPGVPVETSYWINWVAWWTFRSLVGVFGYMDVWLTDTGLPRGSNGLYFAWLALALTAGVGAMLWLRSSSKGASSRAIALVGGGFLLLVTLSFIRFNNTYFQAQGRYLLPALAPLCALLAGGVGFFLRKRVLLGGALVGLVFLGTSLYALSRLPEEFGRRTTISRGRLR